MRLFPFFALDRRFKCPAARRIYGCSWVSCCPLALLLMGTPSDYLRVLAP